MMLSSDDAPALPLWINGHAFLTVVERFYDIADPVSGTTLRRTPLCGAESCDEAVSAAIAALPTWSATPIADRLAILATVAGRLEGYASHFAQLIAEESGKDAAAAADEVGAAISTLRQDFAAGLSTPAPRVLALLVDDSAPLLGAAALIAPALAAGSTVIVKPSPKAPSCALALVELLTQAGIPDGVGNLVHGDDAAIAALATHRNVAQLAFAGNTGLAVKIAALSEPAGKPLFAAPIEQACRTWHAHLSA